MIQVLMAIAQLCVLPSGHSLPLTTDSYQLSCQQNYINCFYNKKMQHVTQKTNESDGDLLAKCVSEKKL